MPTLEQDITTIRSAIYGKDMREAIADGLENTKLSDDNLKSQLDDTNAKVGENTQAIKNISVVISSQAGVNYSDDETHAHQIAEGRNVCLYCIDKDNSEIFYPLILPNVPLDYSSSQNRDAALSLRNSDGAIAQNTTWLLDSKLLDIPFVNPGSSTGAVSEYYEKMFTVFTDEQPYVASKLGTQIDDYWSNRLKISYRTNAVFKSSGTQWTTAISGYYNSVFNCIPEVVLVNDFTKGTENGRECIYIPAWVKWPQQMAVDHSIADKACKAYTAVFLEYVSHCKPGNTAVYTS